MATNSLPPGNGKETPPLPQYLALRDRIAESIETGRLAPGSNWKRRASSIAATAAAGMFHRHR